MNNGFDPIFDNNSEILILGSFPSVKSREIGFYYGNPRNKFWDMLSMIFNAEFTDTESKINFLIKQKIALWDIIDKCDIKGSSDSDITKTNSKIVDLISLLNKAPNIKAILCNGKTSYNTVIKNYNLELPIIYLPSTSPANISYDFNKWETTINSLLKP